MTDQELKDLVASLAVSQKETDRQLRETDKQITELRLSQQETDRQITELRLSQQETDRQLRETDKQILELRLSQQETDKQLKETDRQLRRQLKELGKQIGGLGEKFGSFTEGMALPSMTKILTERFGMEVVTPRMKINKNGETLELDVFAYANTKRNKAYIVEIKSHLRPEGITQLINILNRFRQFLPEHNDKKLYGILTIVDAPQDLRQEALDHGFYLARIHREQFILDTPSGFVPKSW